METLGVIVGIVIVVVYIAAAVALIRACSTTTGTVCVTAVAIGGGALLACFIEYVIAIALIALGICFLFALFGE